MTCPVCGHTTVPDYRPFCSGRCANLDLGNWLSGQYRVPLQEPEGIENPPEIPETLPSGPH